MTQNTQLTFANLDTTKYLLQNLDNEDKVNFNLSSDSRILDNRGTHLQFFLLLKLLLFK